jgi:hypothetical protein
LTLETPGAISGSDFYQDLKDLAAAVRVMEGTRIYSLGAKAPRPMHFPDASGVPVNMLPISDGSAFDHLKALVDLEEVK